MPLKNENHRRLVRNFWRPGRSTPSSRSIQRTMQAPHTYHVVTARRDTDMQPTSAEQRDSQEIGPSQHKIAHRAVYSEQDETPTAFQLGAKRCVRRRKSHTPGVFPTSSNESSSSKESYVNEKYELDVPFTTDDARHRRRYHKSYEVEEESDKQYAERRSMHSLAGFDGHYPAAAGPAKQSGRTRLQQRIAEIEGSVMPPSQRVASSTFLHHITKAAIPMHSTKPATSSLIPRSQKRRFVVDLTNDAITNPEYQEIDEDEARRLVGLPVKEKGEVDLTELRDQDEHAGPPTKKSKRINK